MRRIAKCLVMAAAAAALLLAMLPSVPVAAGSKVVSYRVAYEQSGRSFSVSVTFDAAGDSTSLNMTRNWGSGPDLALPYGYFLIKEASSSQGSVSLAETDEGWDVKGQGEINVIYQVDLNTLNEAYAAQSGINDPAISPFLPHTGSDFVFVPEYCLFLQPALDDAEYDISFTWPQGWEAAPSYGDGPVAAGAVGPGGIFAGQSSVIDVDGDLQLTVVQPGNADPANLAAQQEFGDKMAAQLNTAINAWGQPEPFNDRFYVYLGGVAPGGIDNDSVLSIPYPPLQGCVFIPVGTGENILSTDFLLRAGDESLRALLGTMSLEPSALWFREGCVHYSNLRFAQRNQWINEDGVYDRLGTAYASYVDALERSGYSLAGAGEQALQEPAAGLLYSGGTIAVTSIDVKLAEAGKSLDDLIAGLLESPPSDDITNQYLQDQLKAYSGVSFDAFFKDYITGTETIPASSFSELKLGQNTVEVEVENPVAPAPGFGSGWLMIVVAIGIVFALPFVLEPWSLKPRGGAVPVEEDEAEDRMKARRGSWWSWDEDDEEDEDGEDEEGEEKEGDEPEASPKPEGYE